MKRILLLDDDKDLCSLMSEIIEAPEIEVVTTNTVKELQEISPSIDEFDIIFLDVNLGNDVPNGLDAFDWLMKQKFPGRIIFFTGHAQSYPQVQKAVNNPKVSVLEKPSSIEEITSSIND